MLREATAFLYFFFFNDTATTEIYTLSLHDALPISDGWLRMPGRARADRTGRSGRSAADGSWLPPHEAGGRRPGCRDRKSTRLNSSHSQISYAVFCLKKKNNAAHLQSWSRTTRSRRA